MVSGWDKNPGDDNEYSQFKWTGFRWRIIFLNYKILFVFMFFVFILSSFAWGDDRSVFNVQLDELRIAQRFSCGGTCGSVRSCEEAVYLWCVCGYARADGDGDGVPCEKVCGDSTRRNLQKVRELMDQFGCR